MPRLLLACFFAILLSGASFGQGSKHPFGADDWASLRYAEPVALSPNGDMVLCHVAWGASSGTGNDEWRTMRADGSDKRVLDLPTGFNPSGFTKDGLSLYGTYKINKYSQLAVFRLEGMTDSATPTQVVLLPSGVNSVTPSPDGTHYAIVADPREPQELNDVHTVIEPDLSSLYVVNADGSNGGWRAPSLTNVQQVAWSPDSQSIAVESTAPKIGNHFVKSQVDVVSDQSVKRLAEIDNVVSGIAWTDGGKQIVFLSTTNSVVTPEHVWAVPASGGTPTDLTPNLKGTVVSLAGDPDGHVWAEVHYGVHTEVDKFENGALVPAYSDPNGLVALPQTSDYPGAGSNVFFLTDDSAHMLNVATLKNGKVTRLTTEGDDDLAKIALGSVKVVNWTSHEGVPLEGIATFPPGFVEGRKYPFLVLPHGGPESNDQLGFSVFARIFASIGYVVIEPEYRGSTGYGTDFVQAIYQHFGDRAYRDVDSATDFAIEKGWADPNRLAIMGWSAGGFMTSWTVTQTNRYKAAIEGAGITDWASFMWTSDVQQIDYDARWPGKEPDPFRAFSAVAFADQVTTPLLILHGAADLRVPTFQGREYFEALVANGKTARMVTYPGSGHFPSLWEQRRDLVNEMVVWLKRYNP